MPSRLVGVGSGLNPSVGGRIAVQGVKMRRREAPIGARSEMGGRPRRREDRMSNLQTVVGVVRADWD